MSLTPFGKVLRKIRLERDINISEMAEKIGISCSHLSCIEMGNKTLLSKHVKKIIKSLDLSKEEENELRDTAFITFKYNPLVNIAKEKNKWLVARLIRKIDKLHPDIIHVIKEIIRDKKEQ